MDFFVMPPEEATWSISPEDFRRALLRDWPGARVKIVSRPNVSVDYEVPMERSVVHGRLDSTGRVFTFEKDVDDCAVFAVWLRKLVPRECGLIFCDEGYSDHVVLRPSTVPGDIIRVFGMPP